MKFRKRIIASVLAVVMTVSSLQFPTMTVQAEEGISLDGESDTEGAESQEDRVSDGEGIESENQDGESNEESTGSKSQENESGDSGTEDQPEASNTDDTESEEQEENTDDYDSTDADDLEDSEADEPVEEFVDDVAAPDQKEEIPAEDDTEGMLTEEEIAAQKALEPAYLPPLEVIELPEHYVPAADVPQLYSDTYEAKYDSREKGILTTVKNQNPWGTCWAFSALGIMEASLISQGLVNQNDVDLSERHLAYFTYHTGSDRLGNADGDTIESLSGTNDYYLQSGGNMLYAAQRLMNWQGAAAESSYPYPNSSVVPAALDRESAQDDIYHMRDCYLLDTQPNDIETIQKVKKLIKQYGCVMWDYYADTSLNSPYYNYSTKAYYKSDYVSGDTGVVNHAIVVVGWDDDFSKDNFSIKPDKDGAWIVRNSWGSSWGENGYFYISYEDVSLGKGNPAAVVIADTAEKYDNNYFYSNTFGTAYYYDFEKAAQVYRVKGREQLKAVSFMIASTNTKYEIQIYKNPSSPYNPESGTKMLTEKLTGQTSYAGVYTIDLSGTIIFDEDDYMAVVIYFPENDATLYCDASYNNGNISCVNKTQAGESFLYTSGSWLDLYYSDFSFRINLLTNDVSETPITKPEKESVDIYGIQTKDKVYDGSQYEYEGNATIKTDDGQTVTDQVEFIYSYSGTQADGSPYSASETAPRNAGEYTLTVSVSEDDEHYTGSEEYSFEITKAPVTISAKDATFVIGKFDFLPDDWYEVNGLLNGDELTKQPNYVLKDSEGNSVENLSVGPAGTYNIHILPSNEYAGMNYEITYNDGTLTLVDLNTSLQSVKALSDTVAAISWEKNEDADGYYLYRSSTSGSGGTLLSTITQKETVQYEDSGLTAGNIYYYSIAAYVQKNGETSTGTSSEQISVRTLPAQALIDMPELSEEGVKVQWNQTAGADGYIVERCEKEEGQEENFEKLTEVEGSAILTYQDSNVFSGKTYIYRVAAYNVDTDGKIQYGKFSEGSKEIIIEETPSGAKEFVKISITSTSDAKNEYNGDAYALENNITIIVTKMDGTSVAEDVALTYSYTGTQADGTPYESKDAPVNAGKYIVTVSVSEDDENYTGSEEYSFEITPAPLTISADDVTLIIGEFTSPPEYKCQVAGLVDGDSLLKEPDIYFTDVNAENTEEVSPDYTNAGTYYIVPHDADAGMNYEIEYVKGTLTLVAPDAVIPSVMALSDTEVSVSWEVKEDAVGYYIYRSSTNDEEGEAPLETELTGDSLTDITDNGTVKYIDSKLGAGVTYDYSVAAIYELETGEKQPGTKSAPIHVRTLPAATQIGVPEQSEEGVNVQWSRTAGADGYIVERCLKEQSGGTFVKLAEVKDSDSADGLLTYLDTKALFGKTYIYRIKAYNVAVDGKQQYGQTSDEEEIEITTKQPGEKELVIISGIKTNSTVYNGGGFVYEGAAIARTETDHDVTDQVTFTYSYSGTQADKSLYESDRPPVNAGVYTLTVSVSEDDENYTGSVDYNFEITKAPVTITANNVNFVIGLTTSLPTYRYRITGLLNGDALKTEPVLVLENDAGYAVSQPDTSKVGMYNIVPYGGDAGPNYEITYQSGILAIVENTASYIVIFNMGGHGKGVAPQTGMKAGSLIKEPETPVEKGYSFVGWYKDKAYTQPWDFSTDTIQSDTILFACWVKDGNGNGSGEGIENGNGNMDIWVQEIRNQSYTGNAIKPTILVYAADGKTLLKSGRDYTISYRNNIDASKTGIDGLPLKGGNRGTSGTGANEQLKFDTGFDAELPYIIIKGKGNYTGTIYKNFVIEKADISGDGFTLNYTAGLVYSKTKAQKPFSSIKYKKAMKVGKDYTLTLSASATGAYSGKDENGNGISLTERWISDNAANQIPTIPKGYYGTFTMTVRGIGNYRGIIEKTITIAVNKNSLMKNASITLGSNLKQKAYEGKEITLISAYKVEGGKYYDNDENAYNKKDVFTVKLAGCYLKEGRDYKVSYQNNMAVGTAIMTITGLGNTKQEAVYCVGSKSVTFKITGTAFNTKNITVMTGSESSPDTYFKFAMTYTGMSITQDKVLLTNGQEKEDEKYREFVYGKDYTISYANNLKKGKATMTFTAKPESGYSGSFKKTFQITAAELQNTVVSVVDTQNDKVQIKTGGNYQFNGIVPYTKDGAKLSGRIQLKFGNTALKEGTDYTVKYQYNKAVTTNDTAEDEKPVMLIKGKGNYSGELKVYFTISKAAISDLTISSTAVKFNANKAAAYEYRPGIKVMDGKKTLSIGTDDNKECKVVYGNCTQADVKKYLDALKEGRNVTSLRPYAQIIVNENAFYESNAKAPRKVYLEVYETKLTKQKLSVQVSSDAAQTTYTGAQVRPDVKVFYDGIELKPDEDYTVSYGTNVTAGKNKGSITITGKGLYGGSVTYRFTILSKDVYASK